MRTSLVRRSSSLVTRLTVVSTAATAVALVVLLGSLFLIVTIQLHDAVDAGLLARAQEVSTQLAAGTDELATEPLAQVLHGGTVLEQSPSLGLGRPLVGVDVQPAPGQSVLRDERVRLPGVKDPVPLRIVAHGLPDGRVLVLATSRRPQEDASERLQVGLAFAGPVLLALVAFTVYRTTHAALRPVDVLTREAGRISAANDTDRHLLAVEGNDEIARLARTLDAMLGRLAVAFARERAFVDDASHELRTPIAVLHGELELALSDLSDTDGVETSLRASMREAERLAALSEDLLVLARERAGTLAVRLEPVELRVLLDEAAARLGAVTGLAVEVRGLPTRALADRGRLEQILGNLLVNSHEAGAHRVRLSVAREPTGRGAEANIVLTVEDDGPGFAADFLPSAFERFTRADPARTRTTGAGLGLPIVAALAHACAGTVTAANNSALGGAAVRLLLPLRGAGPRPTAGEPGPGAEGAAPTPADPYAVAEAT